MSEARTALRERLIEMREALVEGLAAEPHIDGGMLALLGHVGSALAAIDACLLSRLSHLCKRRRDRALEMPAGRLGNAEQARERENGKPRKPTGSSGIV
jgi:hypothetical protein